MGDGADTSKKGIAGDRGRFALLRATPYEYTRKLTRYGLRGGDSVSDKRGIKVRLRALRPGYVCNREAGSGTITSVRQKYFNKVT